MVNSMNMRWKKFNWNPIKYVFSEWFYMLRKADLIGTILIFILGALFVTFVTIYEIIFYLFNKQN